MSTVDGATVTFKVHFRNGEKGRRRLRNGDRPAPQKVDPGRIPRISRLMALAIRFENLIRQGVVRDYADLARLGGVSRARISQIMALLNLAPHIQEDLLFLPRTITGKDAITERLIRRIASEADLGEQKTAWIDITHALSRPSQDNSG